MTGRIVFIRNTGKLCFATLQEGGVDGKAVRLQVMLSLANIGEDALADWTWSTTSSSRARSSPRGAASSP